MHQHELTLSRRTFLGGTAALAATSLTPGRSWPGATPSPIRSSTACRSASSPTATARCRARGGSAEVRPPVRHQLGRADGRRGRAIRRSARGPEGRQANRARLAAFGVHGRFQALRKMYNDAGVGIHIVKFGNIGDAGMTDEQIDYYFEAAKALGATGITRELSEAAAKRLGPIADKHQIMDRLPQPHAAHADHLRRRRSCRTASTWASTSTSATTSPAPASRRCRSSRSTATGSSACTSRTANATTAQHAVRPGRHAGGGGAAVHEEEQAALPRRHRAGVPGPRRTPTP